MRAISPIEPSAGQVGGSAVMTSLYGEADDMTSSGIPRIRNRRRLMQRQFTYLPELSWKSTTNALKLSDKALILPTFPHRVAQKCSFRDFANKVGR